MQNILYPLISVTFVSLLSLIGIFLISIDEKKLDNILFVLISFAAGSILGAAFFDLLPEALEMVDSHLVFIYVALGFVTFFLLERTLYWYHGHAHEREIGQKRIVKSLAYLNMTGDAIHNLLDGMIISASFLIDASLGFASTIAVIFHEVSQEIGDFGVLLYGGFSKKKALLFNFASALTALVGVGIVYVFYSWVENLVGLLITFAAGGFIYLAASELIPEIKQESKFVKSIIQFVFFVAGLALIWSLGLFE